MTKDEIRAHQQRFEIAGSLICGITFGAIKWFGETSILRSPAGGLYTNLVWDCLVALSCYLGVCYLINRYSERKQWQSRPHYIFISVGGTTLLFSGIIIPDMISSYVLHPGPDWAGMVGLFAVCLIGINMLGLLMMGSVYVIDEIVRFVYK